MPTTALLWGKGLSHLRTWGFYYGIVMLVMALGAALGATANNALSPAQRSDLLSYLLMFLHSAKGNKTGDLSLFLAIASSDLRLLALLWLLGLSVIGVPLMLAGVGLRGFSWGFAAGFLVQELGLRGMWFLLLGVLPTVLLMMPALLVLGAAGLQFGHAILRFRPFRYPGGMLPQVGRYLGMGLLAGGILLLGALVEGYGGFWLLHVLAGLLA